MESLNVDPDEVKETGANYKKEKAGRFPLRWTNDDYMLTLRATGCDTPRAWRSDCCRFVAEGRDWGSCCSIASAKPDQTSPPSDWFWSLTKQLLDRGVTVNTV